MCWFYSHLALGGPTDLGLQTLFPSITQTAERNAKDAQSIHHNEFLSSEQEWTQAKVPNAETCENDQNCDVRSRDRPCLPDFALRMKLSMQLQAAADAASR